MVNKVVSQWGKLDIVVNNASMQEPRQSITEITDDQLDRTFRTNVFGYFYFARAAVPHLKEGSCIINTSSITAYKGMPVLVDYSATKGAQVSPCILGFSSSMHMYRFKLYRFRYPYCI